MNNKNMYSMYICFYFIIIFIYSIFIIMLFLNIYKHLPTIYVNNTMETVKAHIQTVHVFIVYIMLFLKLFFTFSYYMYLYICAMYIHRERERVRVCVEQVLLHTKAVLQHWLRVTVWPLS